MCSELCKDFYVVYQLEMVAGEVESSCQSVVTFFFFFFGLTLPNYRNKSGSAQPPLISTTCSAAAYILVLVLVLVLALQVKKAQGACKA